MTLSSYSNPHCIRTVIDRQLIPLDRLTARMNDDSVTHSEQTPAHFILGFCFKHA